jgi:plasmid stabilization system protein ParE
VNVSWHRQARREFDKAVDHYCDERRELGWRFRNAVLATIRRVQNDPNSFECLRPTIHRCRVSRFPYCVIFSIESDQEIAIIAIAHHLREQEYWESRVEEKP